MGQNWDPDRSSQYEDPANRVDRPLIEYVTSDDRNGLISFKKVQIKPKGNEGTDWPFLVIDLKDVSVKLTHYQLFIIDKLLAFMPIKWKIMGSNDGNNWTLIQNETRAQRGGTQRYSARLRSNKNKGPRRWNVSNYDHFETLYTINNDDIGYFSKFKFELTAKCYNQRQGDLSGHKILAIEDIKLFGDTTRKVYKQRRRNEVRNKVPVYPAIAKGQISADLDIILKMINQHEPLQHNECVEYKEDIDGLKVELFDYQRQGVQWMLNMENDGIAEYGIHGGLLCDEMGLGKTVQTIAMMLS